MSRARRAPPPLQRRLRRANLRRQAVLEDIDWQSPRRGLDKALGLSLATCVWIAQHRNLLLTGPVAERACRSGYSAYCERALTAALPRAATSPAAMAPTSAPSPAWPRRTCS